MNALFRRIQAVVYSFIKLFFWILTQMIATWLAKRYEFRLGPVNNSDTVLGMVVEPRLPMYLNWFMTPDNSLWGDDGWKSKHSVDLGLDYKSIDGMAAWLKRNACYQLSWGPLGGRIEEDTTFTSTGNLNIDDSTGTIGVCSVKASNGLFQYKKVAYLPWSKDRGFMFTYGWLLDSYVKDKNLFVMEPKAIFQFEPRIVSLPFRT